MKLRAPALTPALVAGALSLAASPCAAQSTSECVAASELSLRLETEHRLRAARAQLAACAAPTCPTEIRKECVRRVDDLNAAIPTMLFAAHDPSGADLAAVRVSMDGEVLAPRLDGVAVPVDPGEHAFRFDAADRPPLLERLVVREGEKDRHEWIAFGPPRSTGPLEPRARSRAGRRDSAATRATAIALGSLALGAAAVGTAFGLTAAARRDDAQRACPGECADDRGVALWASAKTAGNVSTIAFAGAGAFAAGAALVWWIGEARARPAAQLGLGPTTLQVSGTW